MRKIVQSSPIWVAGEVLMDIFPDREVVGGGPANTARALGRLGQETEFIGGLSSDGYGVKARAELVSAGVGIGLSLQGDKPTCTAHVRPREDGTVEFRFTIDGTITFDFDSSWLPDPYKYKPKLLHVGTLGTLIEPGATALYEWANCTADFAPIIFDPNIRPLVLGDKARYRAVVEKWVAISSVVKLSEEDLVWLYATDEVESVIRRWIEHGVQLVILTKGALGIEAFTNNEHSSVPAHPLQFVDGVGAGDTVGAVFSEAVIQNGINNLRGDLLREVLRCASVAAAITCSRPGAQPPTKFELTTELEKSE